MSQNKFYNDSPASSNAGKSGGLDDSLVASLEVLRRWWWIPIVLFLLSLGAAYYYVSGLTPLYKSNAMIEARQSEINSTGGGTVEQITANTEYLNTQMTLLRSRSLLRDIVIDEALASDGRLANPSLSPEANIDSVVNEIRRGLRISLLRSTRIIEVSYETPDPTLAADIPNSVANGFVNYSLNRGSKTTNYAESVLTESISEAREALERSEKELAEYAASAGLLGVDGSSGNDGGEGGATLQSNDLIQLNAELRDAITKRTGLEQYYNAILGGASASLVERDPEMRELSASIDDLEEEYSANLDVYQSANPVMVDMRAKIAKLKQDMENEYQSILAAAKFELDAATVLETSLRQRVNGLTGSIARVRTASIEYNILKREVETNRLQYDTLLQRLQEVSVVDNEGSNLISIVDTATVPARPFSPNKSIIYLLAASVGLLLGLLLLFILSLFDNKIRDPEDISKGLGLPVIGVIPSFSSRKTIMDMLKDKTSSVSEAYSTAQANIEIGAEDFSSLKSIQVTSARAGEGKSATSFALARGFAASGRKTLLIDADLRLPTFTHAGGKSLGLSRILRGEDGINPLAQIKETGIDGLSLLPAGPVPEDPSQLLAKNRLAPVLAMLEREFDVIILDGPPVLGLSDALYFASTCSATIFVCESNALTFGAVKSVLNRLVPSSKNLLGVIMTKYKAEHGKYYYYSGYSYGASGYQYGDSKNRSKKSKNSKGKSKKKLSFTE